MGDILEFNKDHKRQTISKKPKIQNVLNSFSKITESESLYKHLEKMPVSEILFHINEEDKKIAGAVEQALPQIEKLIHAIVDKMQSGGRLFYIGAGTSGRLGMLDAAECPPTFGIKRDMVIGIIAGGKRALSEAIEYAEDNTTQGWDDLVQYKINEKDMVLGITASGSTSYVLNALTSCRKNNIITGSISCNPSSPVSSVVDYPVEVIVGPEFITGSTRMKCGTAEKMALNMISTAVMIQLGKVEDNRMINMQLTNEKMIDRGVRMLMQILKNDDYEKMRTKLLHYGSVKKTLDAYHS